MKSRHLAYGLSLFLLPSCFLNNQTAPQVQGSNKPIKAPIAGIIAMEDLSVGSQKAAALLAEFAPLPQDGKKAVTRYSALAEPNAVTRAPKCKVVKKEKDPAPSREVAAMAKASATPARLSVGKLSFGLALQTLMMDAEEGKDHRYLKALQPEFPSGVYQIAADGTDLAPGFETVLSMPEILKDVKVNGFYFEDPAIKLKKADGVNLEWTAPRLMSDANILITELVAEDAKAVSTLHCVVQEAEFDTGSATMSWKISPERIKDFPVTDTAKVYLVRANIRSVKGTAGELDLQGVRTMMAPAGITE